MSVSKDQPYIDAIDADLPADKKIQKLYDTGGLLLLKRRNADDSIARLWQFKYARPGRINDKGRPVENVIGIGRYENYTLDEARGEARKFRRLLDAGVDPGEDRKREAIEIKTKATSYAEISTDFYNHVKSEMGLRGNSLRIYDYNKRVTEAKFGTRAIGNITVSEVKAFLQGYIDADKRYTARRLRSYMDAVFARAIGHRVCSFNPAAALTKEWKKVQGGELAFLSNEADVGKLLRDIRTYGNSLVADAVQMHAYTFVRPHNIREMQWAHVDFVTNVWTIPADGMKKGRIHRVPLSRQAIEILTRLHPVTGSGKYVFSAADRPLNQHALSRCIQANGLTTEQMTAHGWRKVASTFLNQERRWDRDAIRLQLAHVRGETETKVDAVYNKADHWEERRQLMQAWSDRLDCMRDGNPANVVPLVPKAA